MKHTLITIVVTAVVAVGAPRNLEDVASLSLRAGLALIKLAIALYPQPPGYDAGEEPDDQVEQQDADLAAGGPLLQLTDYFPNTPMPDRPGCETLGCEPIPGGKRCHWRCPHERPAPQPETPFYDSAPPDPQEYVPLPHDEASRPRSAQPGPDVPIELVLLGLLGIAAIVLIAVFSNSKDDALREADEAMAEAAEAADAQAKLEAAARAADEIIKRQAARAFARGRLS
jgi:hypothetical protein